jgi:hypothetical protein
MTKKLVDCCTEDEFNKIPAVADEDESFLLQFLLHTGVRKQEAADMTWDDVKLDEHKVLVTAKPNCRCPTVALPDSNNRWGIPILKRQCAISPQQKSVPV